MHRLTGNDDVQVESEVNCWNQMAWKIVIASVTLSFESAEIGSGVDLSLSTNYDDLKKARVFLAHDS
jgi:hypothetical protein